MNVVIIGGGQTGSYLGHLLLESNINIKLIEIQETVSRKLKNDFSEEIIIYGSGTDLAIMEAAGIKSADVLVAVTGSDQVNLIASTIAKFEFAVPRVVAKVNNPRNAWLYTNDMGVDVFINQSEILTHIVIEEIDMENISTLMKLNRRNMSIAKVTVHTNSLAIAKPIKELKIPVQCVLIAILRKKDEVIIPRGETVIAPNDKILILLDEGTKKAVNEIFCER